MSTPPSDHDREPVDVIPPRSTTERPVDSATRSGDSEPREPKPGHAGGPISVTGLLRQFVDDVARLFRKEMALATSEMTRSISDTRKGIGGLLSGGAVLFAGLLYLLASVTIALSDIVDAWLAALIVGGVVTVIGLIMVQSGKSKLQAQSFTPERTTRSLRKDKDVIGRQTS